MFNLNLLAKFGPIQNQLNKINWKSIGDLLLTHLLQIIIITIIFLALNRIGKSILNKLLAQYRTVNGGSARGDTIFTVAMNVFKYSVIFFYVYLILSNIGVPVSTLIAGAGIVSIAIGLGAQGLVSDLINGVSILLEGQLRVGDSVTMMTIEGTVTAIGLRSIQLLDTDGTVHYIPNRSITTISNHSRGPQSTSVFFLIEDLNSIELAKTALRESLGHLHQTEEKIKSKPVILAPFYDDDSHSIGIKVSFKVSRGYQAAMQTMVLDKILQALREKQITVLSK